MHFKSMDCRQLINYLSEVEVATPTTASRLAAQFPEMNRRFQEIDSRLRTMQAVRLSKMTIEEEVQKFIGYGMSRPPHEMSLEFLQEFFHQIAKMSNKGNLESFIMHHASKITNECFDRVDTEDRMSLLTALKPFSMYFCYQKRIPFFAGLAFSIHSSTANKSEFPSKVRTMRSQGYSDDDLEIAISLEYNREITYIEFPERVNAHYTKMHMSRLIAFSNINENIVILDLKNFWRSNALFVSQEELDALPKTQKLDIPETSRQVLRSRGLNILY